MKKEKNWHDNGSVYLYIIFIIFLSERQNGIIVQESANNLSLLQYWSYPYSSTEVGLGSMFEK